MNEQIRRLRQLGGRLLPPATADDLAGLREVLGTEIPAAVQLLYADHGGIASGAPLPMRLLAPEEARATIPLLRDLGDLTDDQLGVFWTDDNSNYAGVFAAGLLEGRVYVLDHEEPSPEPRWASVESFYDAQLDAEGEGLDWYEMRTDYPRDADAPHVAADDSIASQLFARFGAEPDTDAGWRAGLQALALCSTVHIETVLALLTSDDMWIQARAAQILGGWRRSEAVAPLAEVVRNGSHNGRLAAVLALQKIRTGDARSTVEALRHELGPDYAPYFR